MSLRALSDGPLAGLLIGAFVVAYALLAHYLSLLPDGGLWSTLIAVTPLVILAMVLAGSVRGRSAMVVVAMVALGALFLIWPYLRGNLSWVYFIEHVGFTAAFGLLFARTLVGGRQPLCTFFASLLQQQMSTAVVRYTRQVTVVWSGFLFMLAGTSVLLFFMAPLEVWSVFANFLTLPLIGLMFVLEYLARMVVLPREEHLGLTSAFRAYQKARATRQWATPAPNDPA